MKKNKTNRDRLNLLSDEDLATLLVGTKTIDEGDWWFDGEDETYHIESIILLLLLMSCLIILIRL